jgi:hypothetical protein
MLYEGAWVAGHTWLRRNKLRGSLERRIEIDLSRLF